RLRPQSVGTEPWIVSNLSLPVCCSVCKEHLPFPTNPLLKTTPMKLNHPLLRAAVLVAALTNASILTVRADHAPRAVLPDVVVDDYSAVWVNGKAPFVLGQNGGSVAAGWNAPNRVVLTRDAQPGQKFQIAVFGINGPVSTHPDTYIWVRSATLDFYSPDKLSKAREVKLQVDKKDVALDAIIPTNAKLEKLADGFAFTEGPAWIEARNPAIAP